MRNFDFYSPTYFVFGKDREAETGRYVKRFGGSRVLVVYGGQSAKRSGLLDRIMACLKEENLYAVELGGVKPNPRSGLVYEGIDLCRREKIDFILAVGGGSVIDTAKAIAIGVPYDGDFWDFFSGKVPEQALPVGTVLTIAASGSEGSPDSIITNEKTLEKNGAEADCLRPCFSVLDPALTESLPAYQTACGITDIMAHTFERYFTNTPDVEVTDRMLEGVLLAMLHEGRRVMDDPHNYEARANIMWATMTLWAWAVSRTGTAIIWSTCSPPSTTAPTARVWRSSCRRGCATARSMAAKSVWPRWPSGSLAARWTSTIPSARRWRASRHSERSCIPLECR